MKRPGRALVKTGAVFVIGLALAFAVNLLWPQLGLVSFFIVFLLVVAVAGVLAAILDRRWVLWAALASAGLTGIGTLMLAADLALTDAGHRTRVVVTAHDVDRRNGANGTTYTHHYALRNTDGRPIAQGMTWRGPSGYAGVDAGDVITVLLDPAGRAPVRPAEAMDVSASVAILVVGALATGGVLWGCAVSLRRGRTVLPPGRG